MASNSSTKTVTSPESVPMDPIEESQHPLKTTPSKKPIPFVPAPWTQLRGDVYLFSFWTSRSTAQSIPKDYLYSPLEAQSSFSSQGELLGGLGMVQILRYKNSPVGPYDELLVVPGSFDWHSAGPQGLKKGRNPRISRIYVSHQHACYNGRLNWNAPKHLARFDWQTHPDGATTVKVFPNDTACTTAPFFQTSFKPIPYTPRFPFATSWVKFLGFDTTLVMPPLPEGEGKSKGQAKGKGTSSRGELPGTKRWCAIVPRQYCRRTALGWFDLAQGDARGVKVGGYENFWPGVGRWQVGMMMEDAELTLGEPVAIWGGPRARL